MVKIEPPDGDFARRIPFAMFRMANRNKRSMVVDLKHCETPRLVAALARWADLVVEGFRPGVAARLGIDHATLSPHNPRLVYCSLSGYGQTGPDRLIPGHDLDYLAASGALALAGHWSEPPRRSGLPVADLAGGCYAAIAVLAAHERHVTGRGVYLDLSLAESAMSFTAIRHGFDLDRISRDHLWPTNDLFETADGGWIALGIVEEHFWRNFVAAARDLAPDLEDERFANEPSRRRHGDALSARMREIMRRRGTEEWLERFVRHDVPAQRRLTPAEAARSPQSVARETVLELDGERHVPFPVRVDGRRGAVFRNTAPAPGADAQSILGELGLTPQEIAALRRSGVLGNQCQEASI